MDASRRLLVIEYESGVGIDLMYWTDTGEIKQINLKADDDELGDLLTRKVA